MNPSFREFMEFLALGGPVMVPLVGVSLWMWVLIFERLMVFWLLQRPMGRNGLLAGEPFAEIIQKDLRNPGRDPLLIDAFVKKEKRLLRKHLSTISTLAAMAPLLGLLGTVSGMVATFDVISLFGTGNAKAMAGGISTALITTQSGLLVAIPGLFMGAYLKRKSAKIEVWLDGSTSSFGGRVG